MGVLPTRMMPMGVRKRPYDAEVEWLEVDATGGAASINTGTFPCDGSSYYLDILTTAVKNCIIINTNWVSEQDSFRLGLSNDAHALYWDYGSGFGYNRINIGTPSNWWHNRRLKLHLGNRFIEEELTGYRVTASSVVFQRKNRELFLRGYGSGRFYSMKIYEFSALVRDFIPVRVGSVGYLYDRANPTGGPFGNGLYGNSGSGGSFVAGPDKIPS